MDSAVARWREGAFDYARSLLRLPQPTPGDLLAGISVALILLPQSMAYAELAGLPSYVGLFAAAIPPIPASIFASSPYLQTGPTAMASLLTLGALSGAAVAGSDEYLQLAALLALVVGVTRLVLGTFRLGNLAYLLSQPVLTGFTSAAALVILASQLPVIFGVPTPDGGVLRRAWWTISHPDAWEIDALILGIMTLVLMLGGKLVHRFVPGALIAMIVGIVYASATDYEGAIIGEVPVGFPELSLGLPYSDITKVIVPGVVIAVVGFAEVASISRLFAVADRIPWRPNREFVSQGVANMASAVSGGFPVGGSFSRSSLNRFSGAKSTWSGAVTGLVLLAFLPFAGVVEELPRAVLGGVVLGAVVSLLRPKELLSIWRASAGQGVVALATFVITIVAVPHIEWGVIAGAGIAVMFHLLQELRVRVGFEVEGRSVILRPQGVFWFGSVPRLEQMLVDALAAYPGVEKLIIDLGGVGRIDFTAAGFLANVVDDAESLGAVVEIVGVPDHAMEAMSRRFVGRNLSSERDAVLRSEQRRRDQGLG